MDKNFFKVPNELFDNKETGLNALEKIVLTYLFRCSNEGSEAFPSYKTIGECCGMSRITALRTVRLLEKKGVIKVERKKSGKKKNLPNRYHIKDYAGGSIREIPGVVSERYHPSIREIPNKELPTKNYSDKKLVQGTSPKTGESSAYISFEDFKNHIKSETIDYRDQITLNLIEDFISIYKHWRGEDHPFLPITKWEEVLNTLLTVEDETGVDISELDFEDVSKFFPAMFEKYFKTNFKPGCNYSILHFNTNKVKLHRWYEVQHSGGGGNNVDLSWDYDNLRDE